MKKLYTTEDRAMLGHARNILESAGIECLLKNEFLSGGVGELPPNECWPEIWVADADQARAETLLATALRDPPETPPDWVCPVCGERIEGQFTACWRCAGEA